MSTKADARKDYDTAIVNLKRMRFQARVVLDLLDRKLKPWLEDTAVLGWPGPANGGQPWPEDPAGRRTEAKP